MATQTVYLSGIGKWAKVYENQMDTAFDKEKFSVNLYPDEISIMALKASGSRLKEHKDEDGSYFKFSRENKKEIKGEVVHFGPPEVIELVDGKPVPFDKIIGNGSKLTLKLSVFHTSMGPGTRLEKVCVDEHVPYETGEGNDGPYPF